jgi:hypothetical protein
LEVVNRKSLLDAGEALGLRKAIGERELNRMMAAVPEAKPNLGVHVRLPKSLFEAAR